MKNLNQILLTCDSFPLIVPLWRQCDLAVKVRSYYMQLEMLLIPNALCWSSRKCNCACALPAEVQLRLRVTRRSWQKLFAGKNFVKILVTAQTQLRSYSEQQRAFGNSNICNRVALPHCTQLRRNCDTALRCRMKVNLILTWNVWMLQGLVVESNWYIGTATHLRCSMNGPLVCVQVCDFSGMHMLCRIDTVKCALTLLLTWNHTDCLSFYNF